MYFDLNLDGKVFLRNQSEFAELLVTCVQDGYQCVAVNFDFDDRLTPEEVKAKKSFKDKLRPNPFVPIDLEILKKLSAKSLNILTETNQNFKLKQLSRATLWINSLHSLQMINDTNKILKTYDLVAIKTRDEKVFHSLCIEYDDFDILTFEITEKIPYLLKRNHVAELIKKGIMLEILYSDSILDSKVRRMVFSNAMNMIHSSKGKSLIFSSGANEVLTHRSPFDIVAMAYSMGLSRDLAFKSVSNNCEKCVQRSVYRKSYKGTLCFADLKDVKIFNKKEENLLKTLRNTEKLLNSLEKPNETKENNFERKEKDDKSVMELEEEEKPKLLKFKVDV